MTAKPKNKGTSPECTEIEMDLTDYVMGDMTFLTKESQQRLFKHLLKCAKCRKDFFDWEKIYGLMVTEQHFKKPETKERMKKLIEEFHKEAKKANINIVEGNKGLMI